MRNWIALILIIFAQPLCAIDYGCITEEPTTSFVAQTVGDHVQFQLIHHNGVKYAPVWNNLITLHDLSVVTEQANLLAELGDYLKLAMPTKNCQISGMQLNCFGTMPPVNINGHEVSLWAVYTVERHESSSAGDFSYIITNLALEVDGKSMFVPMKYADWECSNQFKQNGLLKKIGK